MIHRKAILWLYPRLREVKPETWEATLDRAREAELEAAEWAGVIGAVALVAWLLGSGPLAATPQAPFMLHLLRFVLALPLLGAVVGPIYLRRTRRGLDQILAQGERRGEDRKILSRRKEMT